MEELKNAGVSAYGLRKFNSRHLPKIIGKNEHIKGVIYGRYKEDEGQLSFVDGMIVATNKRIIVLNHKPGFTDFKEVMYDMVGGVQFTTAGPFTTVTLNTRLKDFSLKFVNARCTEIFTKYISERRLSRPQYSELD